MINMMLAPKYEQFKKTLYAYLPKDQIYTNPLSRLAYGTDASFYRYIPEIVIRAHNEEEVGHIIRIAKEQKIAITFRASGTSLSGQTCSDSVLVLLGDGFLDTEVLDNGQKIRLKPMVIGSHANKLLAPFGRKLGPDPASINTARIGGIAANNASGMCCGTKQNSYHTLADIRVLLTDGTILDTSDQENTATFRNSHASLLDRLSELAQRIKNNPELEQKIHQKYQIKNTTGYSINALLDFDDPIDMLTHLMIGSEGTLAFISEMTYFTITEHPQKASAMVFFSSLDDCCRATTALRQRATVNAVELLDSGSIRCIGDHVKEGLPDFFYGNLEADNACLLIETKSENKESLNTQIATINSILSEFDYQEHSQFSTDAEITDCYWRARGGLLPIVGSSRPAGSNLLVEDVVFPIQHLADGVRRLNLLFKKYGYLEGMVMGHALEGNMHFILTPHVNSEEEVNRYDAFLKEMAQMVAIEFNGSLKGEHGTGRNIAPFIRTEWGDEAYDIMCEIKQLFDPHNILNPEVMISDNTKLHVQNLKAMPKADAIIDNCIECGFCEPACPSDGLTLSPRQRIVIWRKIQELTQNKKQPELLLYLKQNYFYQGIDTCAKTGMCATRCPVEINTGELMKKLQGNSKHPKIADFAENHIRLISASARLAIRMAHLVGTQRVASWSKKAKNKFPVLPLVPVELPNAAQKIRRPPLKNKEKVVYFISCVNRTFAQDRSHVQSVADSTISLLHKAGWDVILPEKLSELCCGQPFESTAEHAAADRATISLNYELLAASRNGDYPVYLDNSPCALRIIEAQQKGLVDKRLQLFDALTFLSEKVIPKLHITAKIPELAVHVPCSATKLKTGAQLIELAKRCAEKVTIPEIACCGYAGSKGVLLPELNANGLRSLKHQLSNTCHQGVSSSTTCQIGLTTHSGIEYLNIEVLLDRCSQPIKTTY